MSEGSISEQGNMEQEFYNRRKMARCVDRRKFLLDCIEEQVIPKCAPIQLKNSAKPFSESARSYLQECSTELYYKIQELKDSLMNIQLSDRLEDMLRRQTASHRNSLQRKLDALCEQSAWKLAGKVDLISNLSSRVLSEVEKEALSFGMKFDTGVVKKSYTEFATRNHKWSDSECDRGFIQGVTACYSAMSKAQPGTLPRRYTKALENLGRDNTLTITQADKGGGVILMDTSDYKEKMMTLLNDANTYTKKPKGSADSEAKEFNKNARKIMKATKKGEKLIHLLEENPRPPSMRGLPKVHKPGIPMRPITSGIGSAPHRLAKVLAKPLTKALGSISNAHLKNSSDLINRIKGINLRNKKLASFDVKSLFTNVPIDGAIKAVKRVINNMDEEMLPLCKRDYIKLVSLCVKFGSFVFGEEEFQQHSGLAMGSPISAVASSLYMETLEEDSYKNIVGTDTKWMRYVDDVIVITPRRRNLEVMLDQLNNVNDRIKFTIEEEADGKLAFLDTVIWKSDEGPRFSVFRKPTNKDDFIHYLSAHNERTKSGVVIGFFLRAIRICSPEHLEEEYGYITEAFSKLGYPKGLILKLKEKAKVIMERKNEDRETETLAKKYYVVPNSNYVHDLDKLLNKTNICLAHASGRRIGDILRQKRPKQNNKDSIVYKIPCNGCSKSYIGESYKGLSTRLAQHKADVRHHRTSNAMVLHIDDKGHLPNWDSSEVLHDNMERLARKAVEAAYIYSGNRINSRSGHFTWSTFAADLVVKEWGPKGTEPNPSSLQSRGLR